MKATILTSILGSLLIILGSCSSEPTARKAIGTAFEIMVVINPTLWEDAVGNAVREDLTLPVPGLLRDEESMRLSYVSSTDFKGLLTRLRNILIIKVDDSQYTQISINPEKDLWAQGQVVVTVSAPNESLLADYLSDNKGILVDYFTKIEMRRMASTLQQTYSSEVMERINSKFNVKLNALREISAAFGGNNATDFFWASNNANTGRMDLVVYTFPYTDPNTFTREYMIAKRDSVLGANIPGSFPNSHMATTDLVTYTATTLYGKYCGVLRGLWQMEGDMMGGPFVSYARLDETNNRVVVAEGFIYAPETDSKKNLVRRLEASLQTLRLPDEFDKSLDEPELAYYVTGKTLDDIVNRPKVIE